MLLDSFYENFFRLIECSPSFSLQHFPAAPTASTTGLKRKKFPVSTESHNAPSPSVNNSSLSGDMMPNTFELNEDIELDQKRQAQILLNEKKMQALARYGEPPSLSHLDAMITPKTKRGFKPPSKKKGT